VGSVTTQTTKSKIHKIHILFRYWPVFGHMSLILLEAVFSDSNFRVCTCKRFFFDNLSLQFLVPSHRKNLTSAFLHIGHIPWSVLPLIPFSLRIPIFHHLYPLFLDFYVSFSLPSFKPLCNSSSLSTLTFASIF
jgi:hypothetical protein